MVVSAPAIPKLPEVTVTASPVGPYAAGVVFKRQLARWCDQNPDKCYDPQRGADPTSPLPIGDRVYSAEGPFPRGLDPDESDYGDPDEPLQFAPGVLQPSDLFGKGPPIPMPTAKGPIDPRQALVELILREALRRIMQPKPKKPPQPDLPVGPPPIFYPPPAEVEPGRPDPRPPIYRDDELQPAVALPTVIVRPATRTSSPSPSRMPVPGAIPVRIPAPVISPRPFPMPRIEPVGPARAPSPSPRTKPATGPGTSPRSTPGSGTFPTPTAQQLIQLLTLAAGPSLFPRSSLRPRLTPAQQPGVQSAPGFAPAVGKQGRTNDECCACRGPRKKKRKRKQCVKSVIRDTVTGMFAAR